MAMSHFRRPFFTILSVAAIAAATPQVFAIEPDPMELRCVPVRRKRSEATDSLPTRYGRGKRAQAKPKRRPNRMHISKRVRRKHRRAA
jgi:hypothetical protein